MAGADHPQRSRQRASWAVAAALLVLVVVIVVTLTQSGGGSRSSPQGNGGHTLSGSFMDAQDSVSQEQFGTWRGRRSEIAITYLQQNNWASFTYPEWLLDRMKPFVRSGGRLIVSVPMDEPGDTLQAGAQGRYDHHFENLGKVLMAEGMSHTIIRLGWEFNGCWEHWCARPSGANDSQWFRADWIHIVKLLRAIPGQHFTFVWCPNNGPSNNGIPAAEDYPGNQWVDNIGIDAYAHPLTSPNDTEAQYEAGWKTIADDAYGLNYWAAFATRHGKPLSLPEWGLATNQYGGDNVYYITHMAAWIADHNVAFECYFNYRGDAISQAATPLAARAYRRLFGAGATI